jgi:GTP pyrophosphokinase
VSLLELSNSPILASEARDQVDNVRKMLVAMIDDVRVAILKLAERIVSLRAAKGFEAGRQHRIASEVLQIFAPMANRLGIWRLKWELEDLAFRYTEPAEYRRIAKLLDGRRAERERQIADVVGMMRSALRDEHIAAEVQGRAKHIFSIWRKMQSKGIEFSEVYDVRAVRVLVDSIRDCYAALGVIHTLWHHVPLEFDDYIANPKENAYRSLHTAVIGPDGSTFEVQIKTREMHREAELGVCAHWVYKGDAQEAKHDHGERYVEKLNWLRQVLEWHEDVGGFVNVGSEIRSNIEEDRIYVFTPGGHVLDLTRGATPVDFAYRVHTAVGHRCRGARVDGELMPLNGELRTGQRVEIITSDDETPRREWLDANLGFVKTARARAKIQGFFKSLNAEQNVGAGRERVMAELDRLGIQPELKEVARGLGFKSLEAMFQAVAIGECQIRDLMAVIEGRGIDEQMSLLESDASHAGLMGIGDAIVASALCCRPRESHDLVGVPGIEGTMMVHRAACPHAEAAGKAGVRLKWALPSARQRFALAIAGHDRAGLVYDVTAVMAESRVSMNAITATTDPQRSSAVITISLEASDLRELTTLMDRINQVQGVVDVRRVADG